MRAFVDANVLFIGAGRHEPAAILFDFARAGGVDLVSSRYCFEAAHRNLLEKRPGILRGFERIRPLVRLVPESVGELPWAGGLVLKHKDVPVLAAAVKAESDYLITEDRRDFGHLMARTDLPLKVRTIRDFLFETARARRC